MKSQNDEENNGFVIFSICGESIHHINCVLLCECLLICWGAE